MKRSHLRLDDSFTLQERVVSRLREVILKGEFAPGERLVQEELAEAMGVSRMPIREALLQLGKEGLVTLEPHKGAIVTPITIEDIEEIYYLRSILEPIAVGRSIPKLTQEDKHELRQLADEMEQAASNQDVEQFVKKNVEFHQMLRKGCNWRRTETFLEMLWNGFPPHTPSILPRQMEQSLKEHNEMLDLIEIGDSKRLESVIRNHILRTAEALKNHFESLK